jgi:hypothetical protein
MVAFLLLSCHALFLNTEQVAVHRAQLASFPEDVGMPLFF